MTAAVEGRVGCVRSLLTYGVDVNASNKRGVTALTCAVVVKHTKCARLLMRKGGADADIDLLPKDLTDCKSMEELCVKFGEDSEQRRRIMVLSVEDEFFAEFFKDQPRRIGRRHRTRRREGGRKDAEDAESRVRRLPQNGRAHHEVRRL
jgi:hypothetical protein